MDRGGPPSKRNQSGGGEIYNRNEIVIERGTLAGGRRGNNNIKRSSYLFPSAASNNASTMDLIAHESTMDISNNPALDAEKNELKKKGKGKKGWASPVRKSLGVRRFWRFIARMVTFLIPGFVLNIFGIRGEEQQIAWREKVLLCFIVLVCSGIFISWIEIVPLIVCKTRPTSFDKEGLVKDGHLVMVHGQVLNLTKISRITDSDLVDRANQIVTELLPYVGRDASGMFPFDVTYLSRPAGSSTYPNPVIQAVIPDIATADIYLDKLIKKINTNATVSLDGVLSGCPEPKFVTDYIANPMFRNNTMPCYYLPKDIKILELLSVGVFEWYRGDVIKDQWDVTRPDRFIVEESSYDISDFLTIAAMRIVPEKIGSSKFDIVPLIRNSTLLFSKDITTLLLSFAGKDVTEIVQAMPLVYQQAFKKLFYNGVVAAVESMTCTILQPVLLAISLCVYSIIVFKFLASLQFGLKANPSYMKDYVILFMPCYSEDPESLKKTIDSLTTLDYDDHRKLLFVICDGNITGHGSEKSTPQGVLDILGYNSYEPEPLKYNALGHGEREQNRAKVYTGYYFYGLHVVPYIVVVKVGNVLESERAGNRGKRDSQLILMKFLNALLSDTNKMTQLDYEMFYCINNLLEINPKVYELVLMIDADTEAEEKSLNYLVSRMSYDVQTIAVCGETLVSNQWESFTTVIQVYEYYISHHLGKGFESLFGSVTCLPGCFSLYRVKSQAGEPFLVNQDIIDDFSVNQVDTLHLKNLLHLGEDRYLTTLLLKYFTDKRLRFVSDAKCWTVIPNAFMVLLSQRRRWINSTIHNLWELVQVQGLCHCFCLSMRLVVALDLLGTVCMPGAVLYFYYIIAKVIIFGFSTFAVVILSFASIFVMHMFLFLMKRQWQYLFWLLIYIVFSMPIFSIVLPLYAFWHFDDFSWGNTRKVSKNDAGADVSAPTELILPPIPMATLDEFAKKDPRFGKTEALSRIQGGGNSKAKVLRKAVQNPIQVQDPSEVTYDSPLDNTERKYQEPKPLPITRKSVNDPSLQ